MVPFPALIVNKDVCLQNIHSMAEKAHRHNLIFRPHFKTHQSAAIGEWYRSEGTTKIAVSSLPMAGYFARNGWKDITLAFPFSIHWIPEINRWPADVTLNLLFDDPAVAAGALHQLSNSHPCFIKVDNGYGRAGIPVLHTEEILHLAGIIHRHPRHSFAGILIHQGDNYHITDPDELLRTHTRHMKGLAGLIKKMKAAYPGTICSWGDTPSCTLAEDFSEIDEIRPGNFVFYDLMQVSAGVCSLQEVAVTLAAPVISVYPDRNRMILHAGAVHLSKEKLEDRPGYDGYGLLTRMKGLIRGEPLPSLKLSALSQEHGIVTGPGSLLSTISPGDILGVIPVHACLTANLMQRYYTTQGEYLSTIHTEPYR